jgi:hypothetical protein
MMIGFKDAEGSCSNMLLSTREWHGRRSDNQKLKLPFAVPSMNMFVYLFTVFLFYFMNCMQVLECLSSQGLTSSVGSAIEGTLGSIGSYSGTTSTSAIKARLDRSSQCALYYTLS